jgi:2-dehydro-3-deoxygalactonokinase
MDWAEGFIAVDWGTTNRRAYLVDGSGRCVQEMEDDCGVLAVEQGQFAGSVEAIRSAFGERPMLLAGMIGSNRGWVEAPYLPCPAAVEALAGQLAWLDGDLGAIVPGVCLRASGRADVMRGEEVQLFGAVAANLVPASCFVCHPGTHNKWVRMDGGKIGGFRTVMTGEMFSLLKDGSILAGLLATPSAVNDAFAEGVRRGLDDGGLTAELFAIRARVLLGEAEAADASSFASGLLIGEDLRIGLREATEVRVYVMGRPELTELYAAALRVAGRDPLRVDGEEAFLAGARRIVELIE